MKSCNNDMFQRLLENTIVRGEMLKKENDSKRQT